MDTREAPIVVRDRVNDCEFCQSGERREWFNKPLATDGDVAIAVPSVGSFIPGYILIVPVMHVTASCRIPMANKARFASFSNELAAKLESIYSSPITMFEHGSCTSSDRQRSACVDHAHLHLVPGCYDLISAAPAEVCKYNSLEDFLDEEREEPYLMLQDPGGPLVSFADQPSSQFFRRIIAQRLNIPECWDYAVSPFSENVKRTYLDFGIDI